MTGAKLKGLVFPICDPTPGRNSFLAVWLLILPGFALLAAELLFLPLPGIQEDEAIFILPFLQDTPSHYSWRIGNIHVPVMLMDYIGATKSWLYWPIFAAWSPGVWSMRLPACILSVITLLLFAGLIRRASNLRLAICAALVLGTDALFILTNVFDWGPVSLLHFATVCFLSMLQRFADSGRKSFLAAGFLVSGIAVWHKTLFLAVLAAMGLAFLVVFRRQIRRHLLPKNVLVASIAFGVGIAPLVAFSLHSASATFKAAGYLPTAPRSEKLLMLRRTLDGRALEHYMFRSVPREKILLIGAPLAELVESWYQKSAMVPGSFLLAGLALSFLTLPFLKRSLLFPLLLFGWIALGAAIGLMLVFRNAGAGPHHTVLLYPAPQFIVAATAFALSERLQIRKGLLLAVMGSILVAGSNLWLLAQYRSAALSNGFSVYWTDGVDNLAEVVSASALPVAVLDWGIANSLRVATEDRVQILADTAPREGVLYINHCSGYVIDPSRTTRFQKLLDGSRLSPSNATSVSDRHGEAIFCLFQLTSQP